MSSTTLLLAVWKFQRTAVVRRSATAVASIVVMTAPPRSTPRCTHLVFRVAAARATATTAGAGPMATVAARQQQQQQQQHLPRWTCLLVDRGGISHSRSVKSAELKGTCAPSAPSGRTCHASCVGCAGIRQPAAPTSCVLRVGSLATWRGYVRTAVRLGSSGGKSSHPSRPGPGRHRRRRRRRRRWRRGSLRWGAGTPSCRAGVRAHCRTAASTAARRGTLALSASSRKWIKP